MKFSKHTAKLAAVASAAMMSIVSVGSAVTPAVTIYVDEVVSPLETDLTDPFIGNPTTIPGTLITFQEGVPEANQQDIANAWFQVPNELKARLVAENVRILLYRDIEGPMTELTYGASTYSSPEHLVNKDGTRTRVKDTLIRISIGKYESHALLHSIGHWVDDKNTQGSARFGASHSETFKMFYELYKDKLRAVDPYAAIVICNETEAFAEIIRLFLSKPAVLQSISPNMFIYAANAINIALMNVE